MEILFWSLVGLLAYTYFGYPAVLWVLARLRGKRPLVEDGVTGMLVPPRDSKALAGAIVKLLNDAELREKMGMAGRARIERHFTAEAMVRKLESVYLDAFRPKSDKEGFFGVPS